jgi:hypothetical protein
VIYLEASTLLELYLGQARAQDARAILATPEEKVASWVLAIEVPVVLRRIAASGGVDRDALEALLARFDADLARLSLRSDLERVAARVRLDARLARCRSLDAIHVASALLLREETALPVVVASLDDRVREVARSVGLAIVP